MVSAVSAGGTALELPLAKLLAAVEEENDVLRDQRLVTHSIYTDRKNQALRELMAAQRMAGTVHAEALRPQLQVLAGALKENARLLKLHISAVGEISDIIVGSLKDAESDGTYSRSRAPYGW